MSLKLVSTVKRSTLGSIFDTFQQQSQENESPDVKFNLVCWNDI
jgi:hypothetical protein